MDLVYLLLLAFIGSIAGLIGGVIFLVKSKWARVLCKYAAVPFAAGVLLALSLLHLIPESVHELGESAYLVTMLAFLAAFFFEEFFAHLHHHEDKKHTMLKSSVPLVLFGDTIHNFIDGVAIAAAFLVEPQFGLLVALASFLHETPHEIGDFGVLMAAGWSKMKTFWANLFSALFTFPGALLVYFWGQGSESLVGILLAISAGIFLYLGASDFLPEVGESKDKRVVRIEFLLLVLGVVAIYLLGFVSPEH